MLLKEMQSLGARRERAGSRRAPTSRSREEEDDLLRAAEELGIDLSGVRATDKDGKQPTGTPADEAEEAEVTEDASPRSRSRRPQRTSESADGVGVGRRATDGAADREHASDERERHTHLIDINNFDAIEISLASSKQIRSWSLGRGDEARDDQLPDAEAGEGRPLLRAHLRSDQGLGVLLRQVQARPLQGHRLRALRRRGRRARRCAASAWATSTWPRRSATSGSSRASRAASATCSTSPRRSWRRSSTSPPRS